MRLAVRDTELFFDVDGPRLVADGPWARERPTVLLLHTGPGPDHSLYKEHIGPALATVAQVVYLDQRGTGRSDWSSPEHWTLDTWVEDVAAFSEALELGPCGVLGTGLGGAIGLLLAARHPALVDRLVLVSTVARFVHTRTIAELDRLGGAHAGEVAARYFARPDQATYAEFMRVCLPLYTRRPLSPDSVARLEMNFDLIAAWELGGSRDFDLRDEAAGLTCPVLVLAGEDDPSAPRAGVEELRAALPAAHTRAQLFPDTGHGVFRDRPETIELVREFLLPLGSPAEPA